MTIKDSVKLMELYAVCPKCGCEVIGNGKGALECDTAAGYFKRTCGCGWYVEVQEGVAAEAAPDLQMEAPEPQIEADPVPEPEPEPEAPCEPDPVPEPETDTHTHTHTPGPEVIQPWKGFVHIRCEACHKETTTCLRTPTTRYTCRECNHQMDLPKAFRAYSRCECGQSARYLTNIPDWSFDIPCARCGAPNAVTYHHGKDCYVPIGETGRRLKSKKKK